MRLALIGCGKRVCHSVLPTLVEMPNARIAALVDPDGMAAEHVLALARSLGVAMDRRPRLSADDRSLRADEIDAVVIASPHVFHHEQALRWLRRGKPVFVEKPLACRPGDAAVLMDSSRDVGLTVCNPRRFRQDLRELRRLVRAGAVGRLRSVRCEDFVRRCSDFDESWRNDPYLAGGGVLLDLGCHTLSGLLGLCGPSDRKPEVEQACLRRGDYRVETEANLRLRLSPGVKAEIVIGLVEDAAHSREELIVSGDTGTIRLWRDRGGERCSGLEIHTNGTSRSAAVTADTRFDGESLRRFLQDPRDAGTPWLRQHLEVLDLISEAYRVAMQSGLRHPPTAAAGEPDKVTI